jgi:hypothetical protein
MVLVYSDEDASDFFTPTECAAYFTGAVHDPE